MDNTKKIYGVYFTEKGDDPFDIIVKILEKNNLKEDFFEANTKRMQGKISNINFLYGVTKSIALGETYEKDFALVAKKNIGVDSTVAENLLKDIKTLLLPLIVKEKINTNHPDEYITNLPKIKAPIGVEEALQRQKIMPPEKMPTIEPEMPESTPSFESTPEPAPKKGPGRPKKSQLPEEPIEEKPAPSKSHKGPDSYREPIG